MSRRSQIQMDDDEVRTFLAEERTVVCATNGADGYPHLMPLWYVLRGDELWAWTFAKSQKVRNLRRDARATLQVEAGESYDQLRGVMLRTDVRLVDELEAVTALGVEILGRYGAGATDEVRSAAEAQAPKRVALRFVTRSRATWDHRKLAAGVY